MHDVFNFNWQVAKSGYEWDGDCARHFFRKPHPEAPNCPIKPHDAQRWLLKAQAGELTHYNPLQDSGLFRTFAQINYEDRGAILAFAKEYGLLGLDQNLMMEQSEEEEEVGEEPYVGIAAETHYDWMVAIEEMRQAVFIWDLIEARDVARLSRYITWRPATDSLFKHAGWRYCSHPDIPSLANPPPGRVLGTLPPFPGFPRPPEQTPFAAQQNSFYHWEQAIPSVLDLFKPGDLLLPASFMVQRWINEHLQGHVSLGLVYQIEHGNRAFRIFPTNLLTALWLQLAQAIEGNKNHRACKECGKWFEISGEDNGYRKNRIFCSNACKFRDYRKRIERAQELKSQGWTIREIAQELGAQKDAVTNWTNSKKVIKSKKKPKGKKGAQPHGT